MPSRSARAWSAARRQPLSRRLSAARAAPNTLCGRVAFRRSTCGFVAGRTPATQPQARASWDVAFAAVSALPPVPVQRAPRRAVVMPPGRFPRPPGSRVTSPARRRHPSPHVQRASAERPSPWGSYSRYICFRKGVQGDFGVSAESGRFISRTSVSFASPQSPFLPVKPSSLLTPWA